MVIKRGSWRDENKPVTGPAEVELEKVQVGVICGVGRLLRGKTEWLGEEEGCAFTSKGPAVTCWKVLLGLTNKPLYVLPHRLACVICTGFELPTQTQLPAEKLEKMEPI
jgi:hypothetical protein